MSYLIPDSFLPDLTLIDCNYEKRCKIILDDSNQPYAISILFGAKDIKTRNSQIKFIKNWLLVLENMLKPKLDFSSEEEIHTHLYALRILMTVCLFTKSQVDGTYTVRQGNNATLVKLIDEALKFDKNNIIDEKTHTLCFLSAQQFLSSKTSLDELNRTTGAKLDETQWNDFKIFISSECRSLDKKYTNHFPMATILMPLFATPFQIVGSTTGYVVGDWLGKSAPLLSSRYAVTAAVSSGLFYVMGSTAGMGILLLAPSYAGKLIDTFCGVSMAYILGTAMGIVGAGMGWGVGMSLDMGWKLLRNACTLMAQAYQGEAQLPELTGFTIADSQRIVNGIKLEVTELEKLICEDYNNNPVIFEIKDSGIMLQIGKERAEIPWDMKKLPHMEELRAKLVEIKLLKDVVEEVSEKEEIISLF